MRSALAALAALVLFAVLPPRPAAAQGGDWHLLVQSPFHSYRFEDASFLSPLQGWIVNGGGETWRTLDGGASWELRSTVPNYLRSIAFVSPTHGWVGALYGTQRLYETTDGGTTLTNVSGRISPAVSGGICGLWAISATNVIGVGQWSGPAYVIRTVDGGATWQSQNLSALAGSLVDVYFFDALNGLAVGGTAGAQAGGRVVILATADGGATWTHRYTASAPPAGQGEWAWKISFPSPTVGYVSVEQYTGTSLGKVLKTTDGGQTWTEILVPGAGSMQGLGFITTERGWLSGRGVAMQTTDGGATWTTTTSIDASVNRFEFFDGVLGFAMGKRIYAIDTRTTAAAPTPADPASLEPVVPNPARGGAFVHYHVAEAGPVELAVFDLLGRQVALLANGPMPAGRHEARWDGRGSNGAPAPAGVYLLRIRAGGREATRLFTFVP